MAQSQNTTTALFRRLAWQSSIPLEIRLAEDGGAGGGGGGGEVYYMQAPRYTYLPLLIPEIKENLVELVKEPEEMTDEKEWWFEEDPGAEEGSGDGLMVSQGPCKWHWTIDLIHLHSLINRPSPSSSASSSSSSSAPPQSQATAPLRLLLHLSNPPTDKLNMVNTPDQCRTQWVNQVKEADFVRWRNTSRSTGMRKAEFDAGWDGVVNDDFDSFSRFANRILPPLAPTTAPTPPSTDSGQTATAKVETAYTVRALPVKFYLPDGAAVVHELVPPLAADGKPQTILSALRTYIPLLFPQTSRSPTSSAYTLAIPILQGIEVPPEAELAWLSTCSCGADGWLRIGIRLRAT